MAYTRNFSKDRYIVNDFSGYGLIPSNVAQKTTFTWTRTGSKVADHRSKLRAGINAGSPYTLTDYYSQIEHEVGSATLSFQDASAPYSMHTQSFSGVKSPVSPIADILWSTSDMEASCLSRIYTKLRAVRSEFNGMNFLGEMRETIHMLRHPAQSLLNAVGTHFTSLENRKRRVMLLPPNRRRAEWSKAVSGSILELNFGLKPLISDVESIAKTLGRFIAAPPQRDRVVARGEEERSLVLVGSPGAFGPSGCFFAVKTNQKITTKRRIQYVVGLQSTETCASSAVNRLAQLSGFTLENFVPTIYELTPWSWLFDYFSNLGEILEAATTDTSNVAWICKTVSTETSHFVENIPLPSSSAASLAGFGYRFAGLSGSFGKSHYVRRSVTRSIPPSLGLPTFVFSHPGESIGKMANVLSVLDQRRKGLQDLSGMPSSGRKYGR